MYFALACIHFQKGEIVEADQYFRKGYEDSGQEMAMAEKIGCFYLEQKMDDKAQLWLAIAGEAGRSKRRE